MVRQKGSIVCRLDCAAYRLHVKATMAASDGLSPDEELSHAFSTVSKRVQLGDHTRYPCDMPTKGVREDCCIRILQPPGWQLMSPLVLTNTLLQSSCDTKPSPQPKLGFIPQGPSTVTGD